MNLQLQYPDLYFPIQLKLHSYIIMRPLCALNELSNTQHQRTIAGKHGVAGNQAHGFRHGLRHQHMVKGVVVVAGQFRQHFRMRAQQRQLQKAALQRGGAELRQVGVQLADMAFYGDLPPGDRADKNIIVFGKQQFPDGFNARRVRQRPEQGICIQQQPHASSPPKAASNSGGKGASKSSGITSLPSSRPRRFCGLTLAAEVSAASARP